MRGDTAGEDIRYVPRPRLTGTSLPGSGDFYVFDDNLVMFLHYAGNGTSTAFEITDEPHAARACCEAFDSAWQIATPLREYRPALACDHRTTCGANGMTAING